MNGCIDASTTMSCVYPRHDERLEGGPLMAKPPKHNKRWRLMDWIRLSKIGMYVYL